MVYNNLGTSGCNELFFTWVIQETTGIEMKYSTDKIALFKQGQHSTVIIVISILRCICMDNKTIRAYNGGFSGKKTKVKEELAHAYYSRKPE